VRKATQPDAAAFRRAQLAGEALIEIGLVGVRREEAGKAALERVQDWLAAAIRADEALEPRERAETGNVLAKLGDPRFREDAWYLPDEPLLGFVKVAGGAFVMGEGSRQHNVTLPTYYIARYPVTVAQFWAFAEASGYRPGDLDSLRDPDNCPVRWVSWYEALKYCEWLTETLRVGERTPEPLGRLLREKHWTITLPSEAEWEKAARGPVLSQVEETDGRRYPWGNDLDPNRANYVDTGIGATSAVGCFPGGASPYGVEDLSGNVWEWTRSLYQDYPYDPKDGRENLEAGSDAHRVLRGGAFLDTANDVRCAYRFRLNPYYLWNYYGFRVVVAPFSPPS
jgi:formylglycine-generating enzyme required for sulfatase activity